MLHLRSISRIRQFRSYREEEKEVVPKIEAAMKEALPLSVPIVVRAGTGEHWLEAH